MNYIEFVKQYFPNISDDEADFILWNKTAFPFCDIGDLKSHLDIYSRAVKLGKDVCSDCGKIRMYKHMKYEFCCRCQQRVE